MKKLSYDFVLVGFQTYEHQQYLQTKKAIEGLNFQQKMDKLVELDVWFRPFYKNEDTEQDLNDWKEKYYYLIEIENKDE